MKEQEIISKIQEKLGISQINDMQQAMTAAAASNRDIILLSPTGSGKTLAFLIPLLKALKPANGRVQAVVIAPSRELASQIFGIAQSIAAGHKVSCCFGGHNVIDEKRSLEVAPSIIIATPGRLLDHINRE
ncbi:MAG: DEAD/DEAH box helicase, partial [Muribaculaceae bacterium]|nr:DEAD/DEAH box helicase [Muribaculaceae bacterium]